MTTASLALLRLAAQGLLGGWDSAPAVVHRLTAMQAQDLAGALSAVALRGGGDVREALDAGAVVRSWPMRGTLHLTLAEDLGWMLALTTDRLLAGARRRREQLGIDEAMIDRAASVAREALAGRSQTRAELVERWAAAGLLGVPQRAYHLLWTISQQGLTCFGPVVDGEQRLVLLAEWVRAPRRLTGAEALAEWALRYFTGHGPATRQDFQRWTGLSAAQAKEGIALARPQLESLRVDGVEYLMAPGTPDRLAGAGQAAARALLLPGFDELVLGYADRSATVPAEFAERIVPGGNGMFRPTVVAGGRAVGTWRWVGTGRRRRVAAEPFTTFAPEVAAAIEPLAAAYPQPLTARDR